MKTTTVNLIIGVTLAVLSVVVGIGVGLFWAFIGGIADVVTAFKLDDVPALQVAWGIAKVVMAPFLGWLSAAFLAFPALAFLQKS